MKSHDVYSNFVPSSINSIRTVTEDLIHSLQQNYGALNDSTLFELKVILNELLINAIRHGNLEDENKNVKINAGIDIYGNLYIIIEDEGFGYDYCHICDRLKPFCDDTEPSDATENGRGIMILRSLCDTVKVNSKGNKIVILKKISELQPSVNK